MEPDKLWEEWLTAATRGIRFPPDREEVRAELAAHLEDRAEDLRRVFPDLADEEARERVLREMGDAAEIGTALAKIHTPWLGWLWAASNILLGLALAVLAFAALMLLGTLWELVWPKIDAALAEALRSF